MEEIQIAKSQIREEIAQKFAELSAKEIAEKTHAIENRLFEFANFLEFWNECRFGYVTRLFKSCNVW